MPLITSSRRDFMRTVALGTGALLSLPAVAAGCGTTSGAASGEAHGWALVPQILGRIRPPELPARDFPITEYGAVAGGAGDAGEAIRSAISACHAAGGGRVVVPEGVFATGPARTLSRGTRPCSPAVFITTASSPATMRWCAGWQRSDR